MTAPMLRYDSRLRAGPMQTSSSAKRTCSESLSASECTATVLMPSSRQAQMIRSAISPRLANRIFLNMRAGGPRGASRPGEPETVQHFAVFDGLPVGDGAFQDLARDLGLDL